MKYIFLFLPFLLFSQNQIQTKTYKIIGVVADDSSHQVLSYATIRVDQTDIVTSTNKEGEFVLELPEGNYSLLITYVGYNRSTVSVSSSQNSKLNIGLHPAIIQMSEVTVTGDAEDPAIEIMRQAIKNRKKNYEGLKNYEITGYKKNIFYSGERIAMIDEKFLKQIYERGKMNKEFILSTHKTENIKKENMNITMNIGFSLFFVNGDLNFKVGSSKSDVIFPLDDNAFQYYDYKLVNSKVAGNEVSHTIQLIPKSSIEPLMKGNIVIDDKTYAVIGADVETGEGWNLPMVRNFSIKIQQAYANYSGYWIPQYSEVSLSGEVSALGGLLSMDPMTVSEVFSASTCKVNGTIPDSIKNARRSKYGGYTTDTTKPASPLKRYRKTKQKPNPVYLTYEPAIAPLEINSTTMDSVRPLPLTTKEKIAFAELDSTQTLDKVIKPKGALVMLSSSDTTKSFVGRITSALWDYGILHNDRVEGITPGAYYDVDEIEMDYFYNGSIAYATGAKRAAWKIGGGYNLGDDHLDRVDANVWNMILPWQSSYFFSKTLNTIIFTITGKDYFNYCRSFGFNVGIHKYFTDSLYIKGYFSSDQQYSISGNSFTSVYKEKRLNPAIQEGRDNLVRLQLGFEPPSFIPFGFQHSFSVKITGEISHPSLGSDFDYQRITVFGNIKFRSFYSTLFVVPYFLFVFEGGGITGNEYGVQHLVMPSTSHSLYSPPGVIKGLRPYEFAGEKFFAVQGEHNWQALPFTKLGIKKLEEAGLQIITGGSLANVWNKSTFYAQQKDWKPYWEAYVSLGNIFDLLRVDIVRTSNKQMVLRLGISSATMN